MQTSTTPTTATPQNTPQINNDNLATLQKEIDQLKQDEHSSKFWFLSGAIVALLGFLVGLLLGRAGNKQSGWH